MDLEAVTSAKFKREGQTHRFYKDFRKIFQLYNKTISNVLDDINDLQIKLTDLSIRVSAASELLTEEVFQIEKIRPKNKEKKEAEIDAIQQREFKNSYVIQELIGMNFQTFFRGISDRLIQPIEEVLDDHSFKIQQKKLAEIIEVIEVDQDCNGKKRSRQSKDQL